MICSSSELECSIISNLQFEPKFMHTNMPHSYHVCMPLLYAHAYKITKSMIRVQASFKGLLEPFWWFKFHHNLYASMAACSAIQLDDHFSFISCQRCLLLDLKVIMYRQTPPVQCRHAAVCVMAGAKKYK